MTIFRETNRIIADLVINNRLNNWLTPLVASYSKWQEHLQTRAKTGSARETAFLAQQEKFQKLEALLLDFAQALQQAVITSQDQTIASILQLSLEQDLDKSISKAVTHDTLTVDHSLDTTQGKSVSYLSTKDCLLSIVPACKFLTLDLSQGIVNFKLRGTPEQATQLEHFIQSDTSLQARFKTINGVIQTLVLNMQPWRKGPYQFLATTVDAEWRSDLKWQRILPYLDLQDKYVLDVGTGNGYHTWYMQQAGASQVIALEPYELFNAQHTLAVILAKFAVYASSTDTSAALMVIKDSIDLKPKAVVAPHIIPMPLSQVPAIKGFDVVFSMGVLYHRKDPLVFLEELAAFLTVKKTSTLVLETLVIPGDVNTCLCLTGKYAGMSNVYFLPSTDMLCQWLRMVGFKNIQVVDSTYTTSEEQRSTALSSPISLQDLLTPDGSQTIEGHPAPLRVTILATK